MRKASRFGNFLIAYRSTIAVYWSSAAIGSRISVTGKSRHSIILSPFTVINKYKPILPLGTNRIGVLPRIPYGIASISQ